MKKTDLERREARAIRAEERRTAEYWKDQAEAWQKEFGKMVEIRDGLLAELEHAHDMIRHYLKCGYLPHMSAVEAQRAIERKPHA